MGTPEIPASATTLGPAPLPAPSSSVHAPRSESSITQTRQSMGTLPFRPLAPATLPSTRAATQVATWTPTSAASGAARTRPSSLTDTTDVDSLPVDTVYGKFVITYLEGDADELGIKNVRGTIEDL